MILISGEILIIGCYNGSLRVINTAIDNIKQISVHNSFVNTLTNLGDGRFVSGSFDRKFKIWDIESFQAEFSIKLPGTVNCTCCLRKNKMVSGSGDKILRIWDTSNWKVLKVGFLEAETNNVVYHPQTNSLIVTTYSGLEYSNLNS
jgi:WD40 repeat protein